MPNYAMPGAKEEPSTNKDDPWGELGCSMTKAAFIAR